MRRTTHAWRPRTAALLALLALSGCGGGGGGATAWHDTHPLPAEPLTERMAEPGRYGGRFVYPQVSGPRTFNPFLGNDNGSDDVNNRMYCSLTNFDNGRQALVPELAKAWETSADGTTWTWHLRHGAAFSDGHPITAEDVLFSFQVVYDTTLHPASQDLLMPGNRPLEITAPDSYTVVTRSAVPYPLMPHALGTVRILPKHVLEGAYRNGSFGSTYGLGTPPESLVTSGPFRLTQFVPNEKTVLTRNPYWFGIDSRRHRLPYLDELVYQVVPDQNTAALKFQAGEVDGLDNVKPEDYPRYRDDQQKGNYTLYDLGPTLATNFLWFNLNRVKETRGRKHAGQPVVDPVKYAWFRQTDFRRAVSMAIDRDAIIRAVMFGEGVKNWSQSTRGNLAWYDSTVSGPDHDPEAAKRLLAGLGFRDRNGDGVLEDPAGHTVEFTIQTNTGNQIRMQMANFVRDDLAKVGIRVNAAPVDFKQLTANLREGFQYEAVLLGLQGGVPPDPAMGQNVVRSSGLNHFWNVKQSRPETRAEARIDSLIEINVTSSDSTLRHQTWHEVQSTLNQECFLVWLPVIRLKAPVRNSFGNLEPSAISHRLLWNIDRVYWKGPASRT